MEGTVVLFGTIVYPLLAAVTAYGARKRSWRTQHILALVLSGTVFLSSVLPLLLLGNRTAEFRWSGFSEGIFLEYSLLRGVLLTFAGGIVWFAAFLATRWHRAGEHPGRYYAFLLLSGGGCAGCILSGDLTTLILSLVFASAGTLGMVLQNETERTKEAGISYFAMLTLSFALLLLGAFLLEHAAGTLEWGELDRLRRQSGLSPMAVCAGILLLIGFAARIAVFPLHTWMAKTCAAVSSPTGMILSGLMPVCGLYGMMSLTKALFPLDPYWGLALMVFGSLTAFLGSALAVFSIRFPRTLALAALIQSGIGFMLIGFGCLIPNSETAHTLVVFQMLMQLVSQAVLFWVYDHLRQRTDGDTLNELKGRGRKSALCHLAFVIPFFAAAVLLGFSIVCRRVISQELLDTYNVMLTAQNAHQLLLLVQILAGGSALLGMCWLCRNYDALCRRRHRDEKVYINRLPAWLDLERHVLAPIFVHMLPFVLAFAARVLDQMVDFVVYLLNKTLLAPSRPRKRVQIGTRLTYVLGTACDDFVAFLNKTICRRRPIQVSFVAIFTLGRLEAERTNQLIVQSVSFGLLLFCAGLLITLVYLFLRS